MLPATTTSTAPFILGIESSCDETACALVDARGRVCVNAVASQVDLHARFGGVVPEVAARRHIEVCLPLIDETLAEAGVGWDQVRAIGATQGPGLIGCLLVGLETAKALAWLHHKPLIPVNHLAGHLYGPQIVPDLGTHRLSRAGADFEALPIRPEDAQRAARVDTGEILIDRPAYPHVGLIVSGGHTSLVLAESPDNFRTIAQTRDDAAGEAYDKVARVMGLGYPGGPIIDRLAADGDRGPFAFTVPMQRRDKPDFSFSGLKTAAGREAERLRAVHGGEIPEPILKQLCAGFQKAVVESLITKTVDAARAEGVRDVVITGGVACNRGLRRRATEISTKFRELRIWFPHPSLCTDNAAMIAALAWRLAPLPPGEALSINAQSTMGL
jgi:N6-L-threonylcarbamoyladenine synthase